MITPPNTTAALPGVLYTVPRGRRHVAVLFEPMARQLTKRKARAAREVGLRVLQKVLVERGGRAGGLALRQAQEEGEREHGQPRHLAPLLSQGDDGSVITSRRVSVPSLLSLSEK